jgi:hypothetical protein
MERREIHLELLLGTKVRDAAGRTVGRIEEVIAGDVNGEAVVMEYHLGPHALVERLSASAMKLPFLGVLGRGRGKSYRIPWDAMDLSRPTHPRLRCSREDLSEI